MSCDHKPGLMFGVVVCSNDALQVRRICPWCGKIGTHNVAHRTVRERGFVVEDLPVVRDNRPDASTDGQEELEV
jgi:uncharacterized protein CbrC (UPF0167 family)